MAQLWLTYEELARYFGGTATAARAGAIEYRWARIKGSDGVTHVRLPQSVMAQYLADRWAIAVDLDRQTSAMIASLRSVNGVAAESRSSTIPQAV
jgi:hypothetical protein